MSLSMVCAETGKPDMSISVPLKRTSLLVLAVIYVGLFLEETSFGNENAVFEGGRVFCVHRQTH